MKPLKVGVIGVGHLGSLHARIYSELDETDLIGVADSNCERARETASRFQCRPYDTPGELLGHVEAVSVAVPTPWHYREGLAALERGVHLLVEKPIAASLQEADALIDAARGKGVVLQVGHVERFSSAVRAALEIAEDPRFVECHRLAGFSPRGSDVAVVLDLMIHDLDIVLHLIADEVDRVDAVGIPVLTEYTDIASARLEFRNGAIANLTASRVSREKMRKIRFFQSNAYVSVDCLAGKTEVFRRLAVAGAGPEGFSIEHECMGMEAKEPLKEEIRAFTRCIRDGSQPVVGGVDGRAALELALRVLEDIERRRGVALKR
ncbi:MAG: Gfo/Idh/MocA family oxidoreductase [Candidatus Eisenbacteria sp.]|nr:Gfo/Idh/MocA family oxidoreductase [Candidatus Eisenbacteria bacterium]